MIFAIVDAALAPLIGAIDAFESFWGARDDPTWETRWRSLRERQIKGALEAERKLAAAIAS